MTCPATRTSLQSRLTSYARYQLTRPDGIVGMRTLLGLKEREGAMTSPDISTGEPQAPVAMPGRRWIDRVLL